MVLLAMPPLLLLLPLSGAAAGASPAGTEGDWDEFLNFVNWNISGSSQGQAGWAFEQPDEAEDIPGSVCMTVLKEEHSTVPASASCILFYCLAPVEGRTETEILAIQNALEHFTRISNLLFFVRGVSQERERKRESSNPCWKWLGNTIEEAGELVRF